MPLLFAQVKAREEIRLHRLMATLSNYSMQYLEQTKGTVERLGQNLKLYAPLFLQKERQRIILNESKLQSADPKHILQLGFSIARIGGKAIKCTNELKEGDEIETTLASGTFKSTITWKIED
jgi:exodeoxyribonuclease VII large subunit